MGIMINCNTSSHDEASDSCGYVIRMVEDTGRSDETCCRHYQSMCTSPLKFSASLALPGIVYLIISFPSVGRRPERRCKKCLTGDMLTILSQFPKEVARLLGISIMLSVMLLRD